MVTRGANGGPKRSSGGRVATGVARAAHAIAAPVAARRVRAAYWRMRINWRYLARAWATGAALWAGFVMVRLPLRIATGTILARNVAPAFGRGMLFGLPFILLAPAFHQLARGVLRGTLSRRRAAVTAVALLLVVFAVEPAVMLFFGIRTPGDNYDYVRFALGRTDSNVLAFVAALAAASVITYRLELQRARLRSARLQTQLLEARLQVLLLQLQPHFLFNALNSIAELVHRDVGRARQILGRLGALVRSTFDRPGTQLVTVADEADWLRAYAEIQETRFADALTVEFEIDPGVSGATVPRLLVQPLLENAIRHGIGQGGPGGRVRVTARAEGARLRLEVTDNGAGVPAAGMREGVGLGLTRRRLAQLYGADAGLALRAAPGGGTIASIDLPLRQAAPAPVDGGDAAPTEAGTPLLQGAPMTARGAALAIVAGWTLVYVAGFSTSLTEFLPHLPVDEAVRRALRSRAVEIAPWVLATPLIIVWTRWIATRVRNPALLAGCHIAAGAAAVVLQQALYRAIDVIKPEYPPLWITSYMVWGTMVYVAIAATAHVWIVQQRYAEEALAGEMLARDLAQAEVDAVSWRLQPDFVAGVLDDVAMLAGSDPLRADALTVALGDLMRIMLDGAGVADAAPDPGRELALARGRAELDALRRPAHVRSA